MENQNARLNDQTLVLHGKHLITLAGRLSRHLFFYYFDISNIYYLCDIRRINPPSYITYKGQKTVIMSGDKDVKTQRSCLYENTVNKRRHHEDCRN